MDASRIVERSMKEIERRHRERMKELDERPAPEGLMEPSELLDRIWLRV